MCVLSQFYDLPVKIQISKLFSAFICQWRIPIESQVAYLAENSLLTDLFRQTVGMSFFLCPVIDLLNQFFAVESISKTHKKISQKSRVFAFCQS